MPMVEAVEDVRRMGGGSQAHLMRCSDGGHYVVKFLDNPQHRRVVVNEWLAAGLATLLRLPVPQTAVVGVSADLIGASAELVVQLPHGWARVRAGAHFGSRYPGDPAADAVYDLLPDERLYDVGNLRDFLGMLVFDKWTCNTDQRQVIFCRAGRGSPFRALMVDHGFCFNGDKWDFPDSPLRGIYGRSLVYHGVKGIESFEPWLGRLENGIREDDLGMAAAGAPPEWYDFDRTRLDGLLNLLWRRRHRVRELLAPAARGLPYVFPKWRGAACEARGT